MAYGPAMMARLRFNRVAGEGSGFEMSGKKVTIDKTEEHQFSVDNLD